MSMDKFKDFWCIWWPLVVVVPILAALLCLGLWTTSERTKLEDQADKLCYPYIVMVQNDDIVVCAGIEEPVVKKRK